MIQSVLIPKSNFSLKSAIKWLLEHDYKFKKVDITENYYRFRQIKPKKSDKYYTINLPNGVKLINI